MGNYGTISPGTFGPADRLLGLLATTCDRFELAEKHFVAAMAQCEANGTPTFLAESLFNYAEMLLRRDGPGDRDDAQPVLARAIEQARAIEYVWLVEKAMRLKLETQGLAGADVHTSIDAVQRVVASEHPDLRGVAADDGTVTIMFSDIAGSTARAEALGDERWLALIRGHNAIVREHVQACGGREVANRGDGFMVVFSDPCAAVDCAIAIQKAFAATPPAEVPTADLLTA